LTPAAALPPVSIYALAGAGYRRSSRRVFCGLEVDGVELLGEPVVDRLEERQAVSGTALIAQ
jgi:hypothetical protein